jgi:glycosyltransferase involved in cell wall biosynthesis
LQDEIDGAERKIAERLLKKKSYIVCREFCRDRLKKIYASGENELFCPKKLPIQDKSLPLVSILIPTWNRPQLFRETFFSALNQSYPNIEVIVCDNGTNEETYEFMMDYVENKRVTYFRNKAAKSKRENFLAFYRLGLVHGEYMQWLMDDDLIDEDKISVMMNVFLEYPNVTLVTSVRRTIDGKGRIKEREYKKLCESSLIVKNTEIARKMLVHLGNVIGEPSTTLFRKSDLKHNYYDAASRGYTTISDVAMWLELLERGDLCYIARPLSSFRQHEGQEQYSANSMLNSRNEWLKLVCEYYQRRVFIKTADDVLAAMKLWADDYEKLLDDIKNINGAIDQNILNSYKRNAAEIKRFIAGGISAAELLQCVLK